MSLLSPAPTLAPFAGNGALPLDSILEEDISVCGPAIEEVARRLRVEDSVSQVRRNEDAWRSLCGRRVLKL